MANNEATQTTPARDDYLSDEDVADGIAALRETYFRQPADPTVAVADGYGIRIRVECGCLEVSDGLGSHRRLSRWPRAERSLRRLVVLGHGPISTEAMAFCRSVGATLVVANDNGLILATSPAGPDDARLRRAQALAAGSEIGTRIVRYLLAAKLHGQAETARGPLNNPTLADSIDAMAAGIQAEDDLHRIKNTEALASQAHWAAWPSNDVVHFVTKDERRVPAGWRNFDGRQSPLTGWNDNRRSCQVVNSLLNYLYRLAAIEGHLAAIILGLDPGLSIGLHPDAPGRASLSLDLMEVARGPIEQYVLRLASSHRFQKRDFHELPTGELRILSPLTHALSETLPEWGRVIAPHAEAVVHILSDQVPEGR
jgi:CRISPR-associated endonuclease Cas1